MSQANSPCVAARRDAAVAAAMRDVRRLVAASPGGTPDAQALERIAALLRTLAGAPDLFPDSTFPAPTGEQVETLYLLSQDENLDNALYLFRPAPGMRTPPHNHSTWAVIAGIEGLEPNTIWRRVDDGEVAGHSRLEVAREQAVGPGDSLWFTAAGIHSIAIEGERAIKHLHLYGHSLMDLPERIDFDVAAGTHQALTEKPLVQVALADPPF